MRACRDRERVIQLTRNVDNDQVIQSVEVALGGAVETEFELGCGNCSSEPYNRFIGLRLTENGEKQ